MSRKSKSNYCVKTEVEVVTDSIVVVLFIVVVDANPGSRVVSEN